MKEVLSSYFRRRFKSGLTEEAAREIHETARDYYGGNFPNRQRTGCPPPAAFRKLIEEDGLPGADLRNHLFGCSECFNEYRTLLRQSKSAEYSKKHAFPFRLKLLTASALAATFIVLSGLLWSWKTDSNYLQTAQNDELEVARDDNTNVVAAGGAVAENAETNLNAATEKQPKIVAENNSNNIVQNKQSSRAAEKQSAAKRIEPKLLAKNEVEINLSQPVWRDSASGANRKIVRLEAKETALRVKLPKENPAGVYQIFLVDEFGKTLTEKKSVRVKNRALVVHFDLRKIGGNQKRLCFAPIGEIPDCVVVGVEAPK